MTVHEPATKAPRASLGDLVSAIFNGAPTPEAAEAYTAQLTALISLYICFVALFLVGVYVRAIKGRRDMDERRRTFKIWMAYALMLSIAAIAASLAAARADPSQPRMPMPPAGTTS